MARNFISRLVFMSQLRANLPSSGRDQVVEKITFAWKLLATFQYLDGLAIGANAPVRTTTWEMLKLFERSRSLRLLVLADTHALKKAEIPPQIDELNNSIDAIVHAGDFTGDDFLMGLAQIAPLLAVRGNMDHGELTGTKPDTLLVEILGWKIGITHGHMGISDLRLQASSRFPGADLVVTGHTHQHRLDLIDDVIFFNPGSLLRPRDETMGTFGIVQLSRTEIDCSIFERDEFGSKKIAGKVKRRSL